MYFSSPGSQVHADAASGRRVLLSFATHRSWIDQYVPSFKSIMLDSGSFSTLNSGTKIDAHEFVNWTARYPFCDAWAGMDDIGGNWKLSMELYKHGGFPTYHSTDPVELLPELIAMAKERPVNGRCWIGIGLLPPRSGYEPFLRETLEQLEDEPLHVHGWALGAYAYMPQLYRLDSFDSTNWFRDGFKIRQQLPWLTYAEALDISIKRLERKWRVVKTEESQQQLLGLTMNGPT